MEIIKSNSISKQTHYTFSVASLCADLPIVIVYTVGVVQKLSQNIIAEV